MRRVIAILDRSPHKSPHSRGKDAKLGNALSLYGRVVNRAGLEPATRCCIQKCYVVGSSSISLRHTSRFCTVFGTVLFPNLFPDSQKCNEPMLLAGVVTIVELSRVEFKAQLE
jgi:hypothetical protein